MKIKSVSLNRNIAPLTLSMNQMSYQNAFCVIFYVIISGLDVHMTIYGVNFRHNGRLSRHWLRHKSVEAQNHVPVLLSPENCRQITL